MTQLVTISLFFLSNIILSMSALATTSVEFVLSSEQTKDSKTHEVDGSYNKFDVSSLFSLTENDEVRLYGSALYITNDSPTYENELKGDLAEIMYRRKNILNEEYHGVYLESELKYYTLLDAPTRDLYGFDGAFIPQLIFKKRLGRSFSTELKLRHHFYNVNNNKLSTLNNESRIYFTPTYIITRSLFFSTTFKYQHKRRRGNSFSYRTRSSSPRRTDHLTAHAGLLYLVNHKFMIEGYAESEVMTSHDNQTLKEDWEKDYVLGAALYLTAF